MESIEVVGREEAQCIKVAASDSLYLTRNFIVTHNTVCTVELVKRLDAKTVLLIGPLNVDKAWKTTFENQGVDLPFVHINSTKAGLQAFADLKARVPGIYYIGREFFALSGTDKKRKDGTYARKARWSWASVKPDVACWDEAHSASNRKTASADALRPLKAGYKVALSATPAGNKFQGFWAVTRWLWPEQIPKSFWKWADEWAVVEPDEYTYKKVTGEKNPGAFVKSLPCYVKLEANLQEPLVKRFECPLTPEQRKQFDELKKQAMTWIDNNPLVADLPITLKIRLRQATLAEMNLEVGDDGTERVYFDLDAPSSKIDTIEQIIAANPDENLLILTDSQRFAEVAAHRLAPCAVEWSGKTSKQERQDILETFGRPGGPKYIVGVIPALAEGVDGLQHHARIVVWCNKSTNNLLNIQASGRLNRTGQKHRVTSVELVAPNTLDTAEIDWLNVTAAEMKASLTNI